MNNEKIAIIIGILLANFAFAQDMFNYVKKQPATKRKEKEYYKL
ncbi:MAG: hypothetical protein Q4C75_07495 [Bergeyella zoohelcum]|nr:hypothetical protein [Bergeyella zoohelcum]